jgi:hypothetical protein
MIRTLSLVVWVDQSLAYCRLVNEQEGSAVAWETGCFRPLANYGNFYDFLRSKTTRKIVGVELHLSSQEYDRILMHLPGFERLEPAPTIVSRWRFWFKKEPADNCWEQIFSQNPFLSDDGQVLLVVQAWHLDDREFAQLASYAEQRVLYGVEPTE